MSKYLLLDIKNTDERLPAYARLRDVFTSHIASGEWGPKKPIPSENVLANNYGVSIGTVRKAVDGLVQEGLLERRQGSGTYIRQPSFDATLFRFFQIRSPDGTRSSIPSSQLVLRTITTAPREAKQALGVNDVIKIVRLRSLADEPILYEEIYIPIDRFKGFETMPEEKLGPLLYPIYFEHFGVLIKRAIDNLSFDSATSEVARKLTIHSGAPIAIIRRTAFDIDGEPAEWRIARGSAERFNYRSEIS